MPRSPAISCSLPVNLEQSVRPMCSAPPLSLSNTLILRGGQQPCVSQRCLARPKSAHSLAVLWTEWPYSDQSRVGLMPRLACSSQRASKRSCSLQVGIVDETAYLLPLWYRSDRKGLVQNNLMWEL